MQILDKLSAIFNSLTINNLHFIFIIISLSLVSYIVRSVRHYIMIIDISPSFATFIPIYSKMTLLHLILPYKLGEIFRLYYTSKYVNTPNKGVVSIIVDRFFDTIPLFFIYIISIFLFKIEITFTVFIVFLFLIVGVFLYFIFKPCYSYLNKYLIASKTTKFKVKTLSTLDWLNEVYSDVKLMFYGKYCILLILSFISRFCEYISLVLIAEVLKIDFSLQIFVNYLENIFIGDMNEFTLFYFIIGLINLAFLTFICTNFGEKGEKKL